MDKNNTIHELKLDHHLGETKSPGIMNPSLVNTFKPSLVDDNLDNNKKEELLKSVINYLASRIAEGKATGINIPLYMEEQLITYLRDAGVKFILEPSVSPSRKKLIVNP